MKKGLRKLAAVVLTATMAMSAGMPAFATEEQPEIEINQKNVRKFG